MQPLLLDSLFQEQQDEPPGLDCYNIPLVRMPLCMPPQSEKVLA